MSTIQRVNFELRYRVHKKPRGNWRPKVEISIKADLPHRPYVEGLCIYAFKYPPEHEESAGLLKLGRGVHRHDEWYPFLFLPAYAPPMGEIIKIYDDAKRDNDCIVIIGERVIFGF